MKINSIMPFTGWLQARQDDGPDKPIIYKEMRTTLEQDKLIMDEFQKIDKEHRHYNSYTREGIKGLSELLADILGDEKFLPVYKPTFKEWRESFFDELKSGFAKEVPLNEAEDKKISEFLYYLTQKKWLPIPETVICHNSIECIDIKKYTDKFEYRDCSVQQGYENNPRLTIEFDLEDREIQIEKPVPTPESKIEEHYDLPF